MTGRSAHQLRKLKSAAETYQGFFTGAVVSGDTLYVATIGSDRTGRLRLVKSMSREFVLRGREQLDLEVFTASLLEFLQKNKIGSLNFSCSPRAGAHMGVASTYKVEATLQLLPLKVRLVPSASLTHFSNTCETYIPEPDCARLKRAQANVQARAILAAAHVAKPSNLMPMHVEEPRQPIAPPVDFSELKRRHREQRWSPEGFHDRARALMANL